MKNYYTLFILCLILTAISVKSQEVKFKPRLISFRNERLALGIGFEMSGPGIMKFQGAPNGADVKFDHPFDTTKSPYFNYSLEFDLYSPNSLLGIWSSAGYSINYFYIKGTHDNLDLFKYTKVEIPFFLKIRTGQRNGKLHAWFGVGGSYNIILDCRRYYYPTTQLNYAEDKNKNQLKNNFSLGALVGFEIVNFNKDNGPSKSNINIGKYRLFIFSRFNYYFQECLNNSYRAFEADGTESAISDYPKFSLKYSTLSFGVKFFFQLPKKMPQ